MKKTLYTLVVDGYSQELTALTHPLLKRYADKMRADFFVITQRKWPMMPPVYEKFQIYDLARERGDERSLYIDSDALVHPDFYDISDYVPRDTVCHNGSDNAGNRWTYDEFFRRDGRHIGSCNWFTLCSDWTLDLWRQQDDLTYAEMLARIHPTLEELRTVITADHLIDDYILSRNIARYGLKFTTVGEIMKRMGDTGNYLWHQYTLPLPEKIEQMKAVLSNWKVVCA